MLVVREILGVGDTSLSAGRRVERLVIDSAEASRPRLRRTTDAGTDVALDLPRGTYLRHAAVLADDGDRVIIVERKKEEALVIRLSTGLPPAELLRQAVALGHAFGNQHVPIEIAGEEVRVPVTTSHEVVMDTVRKLGLHDANVDFALVRLGCNQPLGSPGHTHP